MSRVARNIIAGFGGNAWNALMSLAFVPFYLEFLGMEAYGLIGVFATLQAMVSILDFGLSATLNKEVASLSTRDDGDQEMHDVVRSLSFVFWGVAVVIGLGVVAIAPLIGRSWVQAEALEPDAVVHAVMLIGAVIALQWPLRLYRGGLHGMQAHVPVAVVKSVATTIRSGGAALVLWLVSPTIHAFFLWQALVAVTHTAVMAWMLRRTLPAADRAPRFSSEIIKRIWRFAAGMSGIAIVALMLTQLDKILLSKLLPLDQFGYYVLAGSVTAVLYQLRGPVSLGVFPRMTQLVVTGEVEDQIRLFHRATQLVTVMTVPAAMVLSAFAVEVIWVWTGDTTAAEQAGPIMRLLIIGTCVNSLMTAPHTLQLAHGWTSLAFFANLIALILVAPALFIVAPRYGGVGAASVWVALNVVHFFATINVMFTRLLRSERWRWYLADIGAPAAICALVVAGGRALVVPSGRLVTLLQIGLVGAVALTGAVLAAPEARGFTRRFLRRLGAGATH